MSEATDAAKPAILAMMKGRDARLSETDQKNLRLWIAIKTITSEYCDLNSISVSEQDRNYVFKHKDSPPDWRIWIGNIQNPRQPTMYAHYPCVVNLDGLLLEHHNYRTKFNTHATTYAVENMFIHVIVCPYAGIFHDWRMPEDVSHLLRCISPVSGLGIVWPPPALSPRNLDSAIGAFRRFMFKIAEDIHGVRLPDIS